MNLSDSFLSVVVPLHNESPNVLPLTRRVHESLGDRAAKSELILVDDASTDDTWQKIIEAQASFPFLRPIRHVQNRGQSTALWNGFCASRGQVLATLDGDLQNDPADLSHLLAGLEDCDMVTGVRVKRADNSVRRISSKIARLARRLVLGMDFADTGCNLRVFRREVLACLPPFDGLHRFMPVLVRNAGMRVKEQPVSHHPRAAGVSKYGVCNRLGRGIIDLLMVRLYMRRQVRTVKLEKAE
jgi:dolichol-phosphate mannosyltransferase